MNKLLLYIYIIGNDCHGYTVIPMNIPNGTSEYPLVIFDIAINPLA